MQYKSLIAAKATAEEGKKYVIIEDHKFKIGEATFLHKEDDQFVFDINLSDKRKPDLYEYMYDVDAETKALIGLRAKLAAKKDF